MAIRDWPAGERPREKLLHKGAAALTEAELLAIFLRTGVKGKSAVDLARQMLNQFGRLRALLAAEQKELCALPGMGPAKYTQLQAGLEMARRHLGEVLERDKPLMDPAATRRYLTARFRDMPCEVFAILYLDTRHRVLAFEELFRGTIDGASVHPSGVAEPSDADRRLTARLKEALALVDIRVLDHFVVGEGEVASFAERGWL